MHQSSISPEVALVSMAHPDDVEFMAGGLIAQWARAGTEIHYLLLTDGESGSRDPAMTPAALAAIRQVEQRAAAAVYGVRSVTFLSHPDGRLNPSIDLRLQIARVIRQVRPDAIVTCDPRMYYTSGYINHPDHRAAGEATLAAVMPLANTRLAAPELLADGLEPHDVREVFLAMPAEPTLFVPLEEADITTKLAALAAHACQMVQFPGYADFVRSLGAEIAARASVAGTPCAAAEAYVHITLGRSRDEAA